jgi:hypothetical protein
METCPHCDREVDVMFGYKIECPLCKKRFDNIPESEIWVELPTGQSIGIAFVGNGTKLMYQILGIAVKLWRDGI